jgi:hypothetical protein
MLARVRAQGLVKGSTAAALAAAGVSFVFGYPFGATHDAASGPSPTTMAAAPTPPAPMPPAPAPAPASVVAVPTVGTPCEHHGWPYVDRRCVEAIAEERVRQVRVIALDRIAPRIIVTPVAILDPTRPRTGNIAALNQTGLLFAAGNQNLASTGAPQLANHTGVVGHDDGRVHVTAESVPSRQHADEHHGRTRHPTVVASLPPAPPAPSPFGGAPQQPSQPSWGGSQQSSWGGFQQQSSWGGSEPTRGAQQPSRSRPSPHNGHSSSALAYGDTPRPTRTVSVNPLASTRNPFNSW